MSTPSGLTSSRLFLGLAIAQTAHSIEEFYFRLFDVFEPARFLVGLISENLALGFAIANSIVVAFIFWTYFFRVRPGVKNATGWMLGWSLVELANGIFHVIFAVSAGGYFPGLYTAPFLIIFSLALIYLLVHPVGRTPVQ